MLKAPGKPLIYLVACCFNEAALMPFFLDYYTNFVGVSRFILFDGGSTDGSDQIVKPYPVEFIVEKSDKLDDRQLMHFRNEAYKAWRQECDWFIVCDIDEFLYHPRLHEVLLRYKEQAITIPLVEGYEMYSKQFPEFSPGNYLPHRFPHGTPNPLYYNKHLIFDPVVDINYTLGCHGANPTGPVKYSEGYELKNLHYKLLSLDYVLKKAKASFERLSDWNVATGAGHHYEQLARTGYEQFIDQFRQADNVFDPVNAELEHDLLAKFVVEVLVRQSLPPKRIALSDETKAGNPLFASIALVQRKLGGYSLELAQASVGLNWEGVSRLASDAFGANLLHLDAALIPQLGVDIQDGLDTLLSIFTSVGSEEGTLLLLDLHGCTEDQRTKLLRSKLLHRKYVLFRHGEVIVGNSQAA